MMFSMKRAHEPNITIGYTTKRHLLLDLDNISLSQAQGLTKLLMRQYPKLGNCLILLSSNKPDTSYVRYLPDRVPQLIRKRTSYHLVFDNTIGYNLCTKIISLLADLDVLNSGYKKIREFRGDMTLRVSHTVLSDRIKTAPIPFSYIPNTYTNRHDGNIGRFLSFRWSSILALKQRQPHSHTLNQSSNDITYSLDSSGKRAS